MALISLVTNISRNTSKFSRNLAGLANQPLNLSTQPDTNKDIPENIPSESQKLDILKHEDYFQVHNLFSIKDLFNARVHFGHKEGSLDPRMKPFLFGSRLGHLIFDLDITAKLLRDALNFTAHIAYLNGIILFIGRGAQNAFYIEETAKVCGEFAHTRVWPVGIFTNSEKEFNGITRLPDLCVFLNTLDSLLKPHQGVGDSAKMAIPTVGILDSNCNPNLITYPVPGNDDSPVAIQLYCDLFKEAIMRGKAKRKEHLEQGIL